MCEQTREMLVQQEKVDRENGKNEKLAAASGSRSCQRQKSAQALGNFYLSSRPSSSCGRLAFASRAAVRTASTPAAEEALVRNSGDRVRVPCCCADAGRVEATAGASAVCCRTSGIWSTTCASRGDATAGSTIG